MPIKVYLSSLRSFQNQKDHWKPDIISILLYKLSHLDFMKLKVIVSFLIFWLKPMLESKRKQCKQ